MTYEQTLKECSVSAPIGRKQYRDIQGMVLLYLAVSGACIAQVY
ncbi:hypothetical protein BC777_1776 [Yoonia maricola]|uniref:Uncharacterized protein n=1 Tax=Yoonia maricola TaxID=420999 RepID=A0A2M8WPQ4_9RHOB|nr:hypothetical protein BC777_1776 [Yoonia maricola]